MKSLTRIVLGLFVVTVSIGVLFYMRATPPAAVAPLEHISVTHAISDVLPARVTTIEKGSTALALLQLETREAGIILEEKVYTGLGSMVERIGPFTNGTDGKYWTYTVNGISAEVGAAAYELQNDDTIEWAFVTPEGY